MSSETSIPPEKTSPALECLRAALVVGVLAAQLFLASRIAGAPVLYCFTRPLWLDEFHTLAIVKEERASQLLSKLARGGDFNPPGLHLSLWLISKATNFSDEVLLRSFSFATGICGLVATYFLLRIRFPWRVSAVGALGMWSSSPHLIQQMLEGRTYSFWFAAVAAFCLLLSLQSTGRWRVLCVCAAAAMMCSIHYFGILVLGLVLVAQMCNFRDTRQRWLMVAASTAGITTLLAFLPLYFGQRAASPTSTWIQPPTIDGSRAFIERYLVTWALALPILAYALQRLLGWGTESDSSETDRDFKIYAGACGLILWPVALTVFSYVVQPAELDRYAVPTAIAYAPLIALVSQRLNRVLLEGVALTFFVVGLRGALVNYEIRPNYHETAPLVSRASVEHPLVVHWRVIAYPLSRYTGADPGVVRVSFLHRGDRLSQFDEWEQAMTRRMAELFDLPKTLEPGDLASRSEFFLLAVAGEQQRYEGFTAEPLGAVIGPLRGYRMTRSPDAVPP